MEAVVEQISVIMLTYNRKAYVMHMIEDILNQSYKNFEYIIIDNGSTDGTDKILNKYAESDSRIRVITLAQPQSIGRARNIGVEKAHGKFIAFVDDDDRVKIDFLEFLFLLIKDNNADISMCGATEGNGETIRPQCLFDDKRILTGEEALRLLLGRQYIRAGMPTKLYRKDILTKYPFEEKYKNEDIHTQYKYLMASKVVVIHGIDKYYFTRHASNVSGFTSNGASWDAQTMKDYLTAFHNRTEFIKKYAPDTYDLAQYSEWSFMISMVEKIDRFHLTDCTAIGSALLNILKIHKEQFIGMTFIKDFEVGWMEKYVMSKDVAKIMPSFDNDRSILGEILPVKTPFNVIIDVSEKCNFQCKYCFRSDVDKNKWGYAKDSRLMEWNTFIRAVEQVKEFEDEVKQISLSGHGEPLCNRKIPDMVRYIKQQGIKSRISIHTNAAMLDEEYAKDLADSNIDKIVISLQGLSDKKYKEICQANINFDVFYHTLSVLYKCKKDTQIYYKIMDAALKNGEENRFYEMFTPIGDRVYVEKIVPIWKDVAIQYTEKKNSKEILYNKYGDAFPRQECCPLIFHTIVVTPVGDVYPCTQLLTSYVLGNINKNTLLELWNSEERKNLLIRQCKKNNPEICKGCFILQNSIYTKEDMIDEYREKILDRLLTVNF